MHSGSARICREAERQRERKALDNDERKLHCVFIAVNWMSRFVYACIGTRYRKMTVRLTAEGPLFPLDRGSARAQRGDRSFYRNHQNSIQDRKVGAVRLVLYNLSNLACLRCASAATPMRGRA